MIVYLVTNKINGKLYVGKTSMKLKRRWSAHCRNAMSGSNLVLHCAIRKYGVDNFDVKEICRCENPEELNRVEIAEISRLRSNEYHNGYNRTVGGDNGGSFKGRKHSAETKAMMSAKAKGKVFSEETRRRMSEAWKHRTISDVTRLKMSLSHIGLKKSPLHIQRIADALRGRKRSPETIAKMSASLKGRVAWNKGLKNCYANKTTTP